MWEAPKVLQFILLVALITARRRKEEMSVNDHEQTSRTGKYEF